MAVKVCLVAVVLLIRGPLTSMNVEKPVGATIMIIMMVSWSISASLT